MKDLRFIKGLLQGSAILVGMVLVCGAWYGWISATEGRDGRPRDRNESRRWSNSFVLAAVAGGAAGLTLFNLTLGKMIRPKDKARGVRRTVARMDAEAEPRVCRRCGSGFRAYSNDAHDEGFCSARCREAFQRSG